ncbi:MAG: sugar phosphate nucleotidyltransferase [Candidatus Thorarchaeota archaeon]
MEFNVLSGRPAIIRILAWLSVIDLTSSSTPYDRHSYFFLDRPESYMLIKRRNSCHQGLISNWKLAEESKNENTPLSVLKDRVKSQLVVMNSDLLTDLKFNALLKSHQKWGADLTIALKKFNRKIAYGVVDAGEDLRVTRLREKPDLDFLINSGIYVLSPRAINLIPHEQEFQMTDLIERAIENDQGVFGYIFTETWIDIGRLGDYMKAISELETEVTAIRIAFSYDYCQERYEFVLHAVLRGIALPIS